MIVDMLTDLGHHADIACNGQEAVAAVQMWRHDLVLMDAQMPGVTATKAIRALGSPANAVPTVALTAHAIEGYRDAYLAAGMIAFICAAIYITRRVSEIAWLGWARIGGHSRIGRAAELRDKAVRFVVGTTATSSHSLTMSRIGEARAPRQFDG